MDLHDRRLLWVISAAFGAVAIAFASFALLALVAWVLLLVPWIGRGGRAALSGVLVGFGALWSFLMWRQLTSQYPGDDSLAWTLLGVLPLVFGLVLLGREVATTSDSDARRA
jgi:apolipoprotein N-acyltransferase